MTNNREKWGLIYCPNEGGWRAQRRWERVQQHLQRQGQAYEAVESESADDIELKAALFARQGYGVIVVVGGDAALGDALNGVLSAASSKGETPVLGVIPTGIINDFASYWQLRPSQPEATIDALMRGRTIKVDVGRVHLTTISGEVLSRYFLNCVNVGLAADLIKQRRRNHSFWRGLHILPEITSALMLMLARPAARMHFRINGESFARINTTFCIGSAHGFGLTPSAVPYSGLFDVSAVKCPTLLHVLTALTLLVRGRFLSQKGISVWRTAAVEMIKIGQATVSVDGHAIHRRITRLEAEILPATLRFLIP